MKFQSIEIPLEQYFDEFVTEFGGEKISETLARRDEFQHELPNNADYLFRSDNVIAELKRLEEDTYSVEEFTHLFATLYDKWKRDGLISEERFGRTVIQTKDLPLVCQLEVEKFVNRRLRRLITKANKQIKVAKQVLGMPDANGLLLLASDGNYFLQPPQVIGYVGRILSRQFSSVHSVVYFTANMSIAVTGVERDGLVWWQAFRDGFEGVAPEFLTRLRDGWVSFLERKTNQEIPQYLVDGDTVIDEAKFIRAIHVKLNDGSEGWRAVQATLEFGDIYCIISPKPSVENWQFMTGDKVRCKMHTFPGGTVGLIAYEKYDEVIVKFVITKSQPDE